MNQALVAVAVICLPCHYFPAVALVVLAGLVLCHVRQDPLPSFPLLPAAVCVLGHRHHETWDNPSYDKTAWDVDLSASGDGGSVDGAQDGGDDNHCRHFCDAAAVVQQDTAAVAEAAADVATAVEKVESVIFEWVAWQV